MNHKTLVNYDERIYFKTLRIFLISIFLFGILTTGNGLYANTAKEREKNVSLTPKSLAWQLEELMKWLIKNRQLVPAATQIEKPFYVLNSLKVSGAIEKNRFTFSYEGNLISDRPLLIPLLGPPDRIVLQGVTINNQPALIGFDKKCYFIRTKEKKFVVRGKLSLFNGYSIDIPGPVNFFSANILDGRIVEGDILPGLKNAVLHLESGTKNNSGKPTQSPLFQLSRAIRIKKEITFEYMVKVRSSKEISEVFVPLKYSEIVLEIPGKKGWRVEKNNLIVPASGRQISFTVSGRLPKMVPFQTDNRSDYEWWLIESDPEHRIEVKTEGKYVDSSKSPLKKKLSSSKLFLLSKGQKLSVSVYPLQTLDALSVVIISQFRKIIWAKNGDLVAEDRIFYENNGQDYIPFDCKGKPIYFEMDKDPKAILSDNPKEESKLLVPMEKGEHSFCVQSIIKEQPSLFGGLLHIPTASHDHTISRSSVRLGLPSGITYLWLFGGQIIRNPIKWSDFFLIGISLFIAFSIFKNYKTKVIGFICIAGFYVIFPRTYMLILLATIIIFLIKIVRQRIKGWLLWSGSMIAILLGFTLFLYLISFFDVVKLYQNSRGMSTAGSAGITAVFNGTTLRTDENFEFEYGRIQSTWERGRRQREKSDMLEENILRGVVPVYLPLPEFDHSVTITKELATKNQPLSPTLLYITNYTTYLLILFWLLCWIYLGFGYKQKFKLLVKTIKDSLILKK